MPFWKDGGDYVCNVADVATWLDTQRDIAISELPHLAVYAD